MRLNPIYWLYRLIFLQRQRWDDCDAQASRLEQQRRNIADERWLQRHSLRRNY